MKMYEVSVFVGDIVFNLKVKAESERRARADAENAVRYYFARTMPTNVKDVEFESVNVSCADFTVEDVNLIDTY